MSMLRTDHCYPPTVHAPLGPPIADHHHEAITMPAALPTIERLTPSPPRPELARCYGVSCRQGRAPCTEQCAEVAPTHPAPPRRVPWLACAIGVALFAVGYLVGRVLP